jgi:adenosylcobinamide-phosphate synthase
LSLLTLLAALVLAYYRPAPREDDLRRIFLAYANLIERNFNDGQARHGVIASLLTVVLPVLLLAAAYFTLYSINPLLGFVLGVVIVYFTIRFSRFGAPAERIAQALQESNLEGARAELATWQICQTDTYSDKEVARMGIEATLRHAHHDLFAPLFWFLLLGPAGALLYRLSYFLKQVWEKHKNDFGGFSQRLFYWLDWLPARFTAGCFAVVGDFEDAVYCWRTQAATWSDESMGIILAGGAGALGVKLGEPLNCNGTLQFRPELGLGDDADPDYLRSAVGLVWRALILISGLLLLLTFAHWLGS